MKLAHLTHEILRGAISVHSALGPGLLESTYRACLHQELLLNGLALQREWPLTVSYRGVAIDVGYRLDLLVENLVVVVTSSPRTEPVRRL